MNSWFAKAASLGIFALVFLFVGYKLGEKKQPIATFETKGRFQPLGVKTLDTKSGQVCDPAPEDPSVPPGFTQNGNGVPICSMIP